MFSKTLVFVFIIIVFVGCERLDRNPILIQNFDSTPIDFQLRPEQVQEDISITLYALKYIYSGKYVFEDDMKIVKENLKKISLSQTPQELCIKIKKALSRIRDKHLRIALRGYKYCATNAPLVKEVIPRTPIEIGDYSENIKIIRVKSLISTNFESESISKLYNEKRMTKPKAILIDLRGIDGGHLQVAKKFLAALFNTNVVKNSYFQNYHHPASERGTVFNKSSMIARFNLQLLTDGIRKYPNSFRMTIKEKVRSINGKTLQLKAGFTKEDVNKYFKTKSGVLKIEKPIHGLVLPRTKLLNIDTFLLIDKKCASACEYILESLENTHNVKTIGEKTSGTTQFGGVGLVILKHSKINLFIPTTYIKYKDNRNVEKVGYSPDFELDLNKPEKAITREITRIIRQNI